MFNLYKMDINCDRLISLIEERRALYDTTLPDNTDKNVKARLWEEIFQELVDNWHEITSEEKLKIRKNVQKRWSSIRDCFRRELIHQKTLNGNVTKKRRKYLYYDQLLFLLPYSKNTVDSSVEEGDSEDPLASLKTSPVIDENYEELRAETITQITEQPTGPTSSTFNKNKRPDEVIMNSINEGGSHKNFVMRRNFVDEDESFLLSLLPTFKKYGYEKKIMLRIEMLNTVLKFHRQNNPENSPSSNVEYNSIDPWGHLE